MQRSSVQGIGRRPVCPEQGRVGGDRRLERYQVSTENFWTIVKDLGFYSARCRKQVEGFEEGVIQSDLKGSLWWLLKQKLGWLTVLPNKLRIAVVMRRQSWLGVEGGLDVLCSFVSVSMKYSTIYERIKNLPHCLLGWDLKVSVEAGAVLLLVLVISCFVP